jgi:hypothetical protein
MRKEEKVSEFKLKVNSLMESKIYNKLVEETDFVVDVTSIREDCEYSKGNLLLVHSIMPTINDYMTDKLKNIFNLYKTRKEIVESVKRNNVDSVVLSRGTKRPRVISLATHVSEILEGEIKHMISLAVFKKTREGEK